MYRERRKLKRKKKITMNGRKTICPRFPFWIVLLLLKQIQIQHIPEWQSGAFYVAYHNFHMLADQVD